jgi:hypothetical protein
VEYVLFVPDGRLFIRWKADTKKGWKRAGTARLAEIVGAAGMDLSTKRAVGRPPFVAAGLVPLGDST